MRRFSVASALALLVVVCASMFAQPTRIFPPYVPVAGSSVTLANPLNPGAGGTLKVVAFGDSVVWGNGDKTEHKFVRLVAQNLANATGRTVELTTWAHSAALLSGGCNACFYPTQNNVPVADVNYSRPNIEEQITKAPEPFDAEVVLVDGCINDVNGDDVALPFPFNWTTKAEIERRIYASCSDAVATLMANAKAIYPKATIVFLKYFRIVSSASHFPSVIGVEGNPSFSAQKAVNELSHEREKLAAAGSQSAISAMVPGPKSVLDWGELSDVFLRETTRCFEWAAAQTDGVAVKPLDPIKPGVEQFCPDVPQAAPAKASMGRRVYLASSIPDLPRNAYGTQESHLWRLPIPFLWFVLHKDEMYHDRDNNYCKILFKSDLKDREYCRIDATAHPNLKGATDYAQGVLNQLNIAWAK